MNLVVNIINILPRSALQIVGLKDQGNSLKEDKWEKSITNELGELSKPKDNPRGLVFLCLPL